MIGDKKQTGWMRLRLTSLMVTKPPSAPGSAVDLVLVSPPFPVEMEVVLALVIKL